MKKLFLLVFVLIIVSSFSSAVLLDSGTVSSLPINFTIDLNFTSNVSTFNSNSSGVFFFNWSFSVPVFNTSNNNIFLNASSGVNESFTFIDSFFVLRVDDSSPPVVNVSTSLVLNTSFVVDLVGDEDFNYTIMYGLNESFGFNASNISFANPHAALISNLSVNTTYFFNVTFCDVSGNCNSSGIFNETTLENTTFDTVVISIISSWWLFFVGLVLYVVGRSIHDFTIGISGGVMIFLQGVFVLINPINNLSVLMSLSIGSAFFVVGGYVFIVGGLEALDVGGWWHI